MRAAFSIEYTGLKTHSMQLKLCVLDRPEGADKEMHVMCHWAATRQLVRSPSQPPHGSKGKPRTPAFSGVEGAQNIMALTNIGPQGAASIWSLAAKASC